MSIIENQLKSIKPGTIVRLTQNNGVAYEGVVKENDGTDSLSVEVRIDAAMRYSNIAAVEFVCQSAGSSIPVIQTVKTITDQKQTDSPAQTPEPPKPKLSTYKEMKENYPKFSSGMQNIEQTFKLLDRDTRISVQGQLSKIRAGNSARDTEKIELGANEIWNIIGDKGLDYDPTVNLFMAYAYYLARLYAEAADGFYYAQDYYSAFASVMTNAIKMNDKELYKCGAVYSAIYTVYCPKGEHLNEALQALEIASVTVNDLGAIGFVLENNKEDFVRSCIHEALVRIAQYKEFELSDKTNINTMLEALKAILPGEELIKRITEIYQEASEKNKETSEEEKNKSETETFTDLTKEYVGTIVSFNFFERNGVIENEMGVQYRFESKNITDPNFRAKVDSMSKKDFEPIDVQFYLSKAVNSFVAVKIRKCTNPSLMKHGISYASNLFSEHKYEEAIKEYKKMLDNDKKWEDAFIGLMNCYLALDKADDKKDYTPEMKVIVDKYASKMKRSIRNLSVIHQYYMKVGQHKEALKMLDELIDLSGENDYKRVLYCVCEKARCYRGLKRYSEAIEQYEYWIKTVNEKKYSDLYIQRDTYIYPEIASLFYQMEDYDSAEKYILLSQSKEKKAMLQDIERIRAEHREKLKAEVEETYEPTADEDPEEEEGSAEEESETYDFGDLRCLENEYGDTADFENVGLSDSDIIEKAFSFDSEKLYCIITYLSAAAYAGRFMDYSDILEAAEFCVRAASGQLKKESDIISSNISYRFGIFKDSKPEMYETMFAAAALRSLFEQTDTPDYESQILINYLEEMQLTKEFPAVMSLANEFLSFRNQTGIGISEFADYKTDNASHARILEAAAKCKESLDMKTDVFESKGRLRRTRQLLFIDPDSILRNSLDIVCNNDTNKFKEVKTRLSEAFIRSGKAFEFENIDNSKIESLIDTYWDKAREIMLSEKKHVNRPYERLIDPKRRNVFETVKRILKCVFDWIETNERTSGTENYHGKYTYAAARENIIVLLEDLSKQLTAKVESGFDWGTQLLRLTAEELLTKMNGSYDERAKKYLFIDFLRTDYILLDDNFQPELYATFNDKADFNILRRIDKHMETELPSYTERIDELFSNDISKNNLRSASLLKTYSDDMNIMEISEHNMYNYFDKCVSMGRARLKDIHEDFLNQLELYQQYGALSDINGQKTAMIKESDLFFRICFTNCDFGFYSNLISAYKDNIEAMSEEIADRLNRQLDELELNYKYEWGIYSKEEIKNFIAFRNFAVAENMMNCIRRNDTKELPDFSIEPFGYLMSFINEHSTNYRAVSDPSITLDASIKKYSGKNDIELALLRMTNNARKDVKGGANLIKNWITRSPAGTERIERLLNLLGFNNLTVTEDTETSDDSYLIKKAKQSGRVNYQYPLPAYSSELEQDGARVLCLYGKFDAERLIDKYKQVNTTSKHTIVLLDYALKVADRRHLARKLKEEKSFAKTFILIDRVILFYLALHYQNNTIGKMLMSVTMPFCYYQPFSATSKLGKMPAELYTGRAAELKSIEDPKGCNLVYGGRQLGKSALLAMAEKHIDGNANNDRAVVVDITKRNYTEAAKLVSEKLVDRHILPEGSECDDWETLARHIGRRLDDDSETRIGYMLLMLDEADTFIESCKENNYKAITVFKNLPEGRFKLVLAGLHNLSNFNRSVLYNNSVLPHLESIIVRPFQRPEATELLTHALAYMGIRFESDVIQHNILARTNYFPGLIQLYCQKLLEAMQNSDYAGYSEVSTPPYNVTESHIKKVLSDKSFIQEIDNRLWMTLTVDESEGSYYMIIANILAYLYFEKPDIKGHMKNDIREAAQIYGIDTILSLEEEQLDEILIEMWDLNILTSDETPDGMRFMFSSEGFRDLLGSEKTVKEALEKYRKTGDQQ